MRTAKLFGVENFYPVQLLARISHKSLLQLYCLVNELYEKSGLDILKGIEQRKILLVHLRLEADAGVNVKCSIQSKVSAFDSIRICLNETLPVLMVVARVLTEAVGVAERDRQRI